MVVPRSVRAFRSTDNANPSERHVHAVSARLKRAVVLLTARLCVSFFQPAHPNSARFGLSRRNGWFSAVHGRPWLQSDGDVCAKRSNDADSVRRFAARGSVPALSPPRPGVP